MYYALCTTYLNGPLRPKEEMKDCVRTSWRDTVRCQSFPINVSPLCPRNWMVLLSSFEILPNQPFTNPAFQCQMSVNIQEQKNVQAIIQGKSQTIILWTTYTPHLPQNRETLNFTTRWLTDENCGDGMSLYTTLQQNLYNTLSDHVEKNNIINPVSVTSKPSSRNVNELKGKG